MALIILFSTSKTFVTYYDFEEEQNSCIWHSRTNKTGLSFSFFFFFSDSSPLQTSYLPGSIMDLLFYLHDFPHTRFSFSFFFFQHSTPHTTVWMQIPPIFQGLAKVPPPVWSPYRLFSLSCFRTYFSTTNISFITY